MDLQATTRYRLVMFRTWIDQHAVHCFEEGAHPPKLLHSELHSGIVTADRYLGNRTKISRQYTQHDRMQQSTATATQAWPHSTNSATPALRRRRVYTVCSRDTHRGTDSHDLAELACSRSRQSLYAYAARSAGKAVGRPMQPSKQRPKCTLFSKRRQPSGQATYEKTSNVRAASSQQNSST